MTQSIKRSRINRNKMLKYFQDAFNAAGIETDVSQPFEKNRSVTKELVECLIEFGLPETHHILETDSHLEIQAKIEDYSKYLRNIILRSRNHEKENIGFEVELIEPIIEFPKRCTTVLLKSILFTRKKYSFWNFWRMPVLGNIVRRNNCLFFESNSQIVNLSPLRKVSFINMPRDRKLQWLEIDLHDQTIYLAQYSTTNHQLEEPNHLQNLISV